MTASGHTSDAGERATARGHAAPPSGQGKNAYADDETGSGQPTTTGRDTSGHDATGLDPRIESGHSETCLIADSIISRGNPLFRP